MKTKKKSAAWHKRRAKFYREHPLNYSPISMSSGEWSNDDSGAGIIVVGIVLGLALLLVSAWGFYPNLTAGITVTFMVLFSIYNLINIRRNTKKPYDGTQDTRK